MKKEIQSQLNLESNYVNLQKIEFNKNNMFFLLLS